jgi:predicted secreted protein with PEFG-CTERM motif
MGNIVSIDQIDPNSSGEYSTNFKVGKTWIHDGLYDVSVFANRDVGEIKKYDKITIPLQIENSKITSHDGLFDYDIDGAYVTDIQISKETNSLILSINSDSDGTLIAYLPREIIDSKFGTEDNVSKIIESTSTPTGTGINTDSSAVIRENTIPDINFIVLADNVPAEFFEMQTSDTVRTLSINFEQGTSEIKIIGTHVVPEFGTIAMIVLAVAIISIIAVSAKSRLSFMPRI